VPVQQAPGDGALRLACDRERPGVVDPGATVDAARSCMLMPLLVRLIDSEVEVIDGAVPQVSDCIEDDSSVLEEVCSSRLSIDEQVLLPDLHIDPIHGDIQPDGELRRAEQACLMGPPGARLGHPNSGAAPDLTHRDRKDHVLAVR
jgi:hypothetical protein